MFQTFIFLHKTEVFVCAPFHTRYICQESPKKRRKNDKCTFSHAKGIINLLCQWAIFYVWLSRDKKKWHTREKSRAYLWKFLSWSESHTKFSCFNLTTGISSNWTSVSILLTLLEILIQGSNREERDCRPSTLYNLGFSFLAIFAPERWKREEEESNGITTRGMGRERDYTRHEIRLIN